MDRLQIPVSETLIIHAWNVAFSETQVKIQSKIRIQWAKGNEGIGFRYEFKITLEDLLATEPTCAVEP